jgi:hypothetical protein
MSTFSMLVLCFIQCDLSDQSYKMRLLPYVTPRVKCMNEYVKSNQTQQMNKSSKRAVSSIIQENIDSSGLVLR